MRSRKRGLAVASALLFLVLFLALSLPLIPAQETQAKGCYSYPQGRLDLSCKTGGVTEEAAKEDCASFAGCVITQWFKPASTCAEISECEIVTCDAAKYACQEVPRGACTQAGGKEIIPSDVAAQCVKGCCVIPLPDGPFCNPDLVFQSECADLAASTPGAPASYQFNNDESMTLAICQQQFCKAALETGGLKGIVTDALGKPLENAAIEILGTTKKVVTTASGAYSFTNVVPVTYSVKISAWGYIDLIQQVSLSAGEPTVRDFTLQKAVGEATLRIIVRDQSPKLLPEVTVAWKGPVQGNKKTDTQGTVLLQNIPSGTYTILISAIGYVTQEIKKNVGPGEVLVEAVLTQAAFQGVQGTTYIGQEKKYEVSIYVDGFFKTKSKYPSGIYSISLPADGKEHTISATYQNFVSPIHKVAVVQNQILSLDIFLSPLKGECTPEGTNPEKNVAVFSAHPLPGQESVRLIWEKPCPEVAGYTLQRKDGEKLLATRTISGVETLFVDSDVEWGKTYSYTLVAHFDSGLSSKDAAVATITLGDQECAGRYNEATGSWSSFCLVEDRQVVQTCTAENVLTPVQECSSLGNTWYCAQTTSTTASCKDAGICLVNAAPFGLYASEEICYGKNDDNFCSYDSSTTTIANQCLSCAEIESCFAYQSRSACEKNNCLSSTCAWIDVASPPALVDYSYLFSSTIFSPLMTTPETGAGYCVEQEYPSDDQCSLCSPGASLFENYFCTPVVCSSLGRCFANPEETSCAQCKDSPAPDATCYSYASEEECSGTGGIAKDDFGRLSLSADRCSWGRCSWDGARCFKDGNADQKDDCADIKGSSIACAVDNTPPTTTATGSLVVSLNNPLITFVADDSSSKPGQGNPLQNIYYCLSPANGPSTCTSEKFQSTNFKGLSTKESISINISQFPALMTAKQEGEIFTLYFSSQDIFFNQEQVQQGTLYVDMIPPQFNVIGETSTSGKISQLDLHLEEVNEMMSCEFILKQLLPLGESKTVSVSADILDKKVIFSDLTGIKYGLTVACLDQHGNSGVAEQKYSFDLEQNINLVYPAKGQVIAETMVPFKIETSIGVTCSLYEAFSNQKIADFATTADGIVHETIPLPLSEKEYVAEHQVFCTDLLSDKTYEDYFDFIIDSTPPSVLVELQEGTRSVQHLDDDWQESFISQAAVLLSCAPGGVACTNIYSCLGAHCGPADVSSYTVYTESLIVEQTTKICYYAAPPAESTTIDVSCGLITIEGFGITLDKPPRHTSEGEMWGVSATIPFDWQFYTKVPTQECKFDFVPGFNYDTLAKYKGKEKNGAGKYLFENFPDSVFTSYNSNGDVKTVYVQCKDAEGTPSPVQKMFLEYDPTPPQITSLSASPEPIIEGISTLITVATDDKTTCMFTDKETTKTYPFPGKEEHQLKTVHEGTFYVGDFIGSTKTYTLSVICENGAGLQSEPREVTVQVDYAQKGSIVSIYPQNTYLQNGPVAAEVITTKNGYCEYKKGDEYISFSTTNGNTHQTSLNGTDEGFYTIPLRCFFGDASQESAFSFTLDRQVPLITEINDGTATCGNESWSILVATNESAIANYSYTIYEATASPVVTIGNKNLGNKTTFSKGNILTKQTAGADLPIEITFSAFSGLVSSDQNTMKGLIFSVSAIDAAGNIGPTKESDGVIVSNASNPACLDDTTFPSVSFSTVDSTSCTSRLVSMNCTDATGCQDYLYGVGKTQDSCTPALPYNGKNIELKSTNYVCYTTNDAVGKSKPGAAQIFFEDVDGDSITDSCDLCSGTLAGKVVDAEGCAGGQISPESQTVDSDGDGLPDAWENQFNSLSCLLSSVSKDSNSDSVLDGQEDYDQDMLTNYQEFSSGKNPCVAEVVSSSDQLPVQPIVPSTYPQFMAWLLLIVGIVLSLGGLGYLLYAHLTSTRRSSVPAARRPQASGISPARPLSTAQHPGLGDQFMAWKRTRQERAKEKSRTAIFEEFGKGKKSVESLQNVAQRYLERKEEIRPQLQPQERSVFDKLESIAQQSRKKDIHEVVSKDEAEDIFEKLRDIGKRKQKKKAK
ncbi:carboxypeptidase regulatory-like domain-containing protein [Candidatus Woesearchaeota archaeon]|nr:carboxypeptidase regulatory-like domain-containing protein [Candidatus Woesearchaeota archaeon]